uniref:stage II sporulation protein R n=1 Tax=Roseburia sp. TaxID=2049040 RepID=UPI003FF0BFAB
MKKDWIRQTGYIAGMTVVTAVLFLGGIKIRQQSLQQGIAEKILRFHVLAASDTKEDQELKLKVRDAVGVYMEEELADALNKSESEELVRLHLGEIEAVAEQTIKEAGYDYPVTASLAYVEFPEKTYGAYVFPAGTYEALEVIIGEGKGHNWWCVMYPNLCFSGSVYEVVDEEAEERLREVLSTEEYEAVFSSGNVKVEWKSLAFFKELVSDLK